MTNIARFLSLAFVASIAAAQIGCACKQTDEGTTQCETKAVYKGEAKKESMTWTAGQGLSINVKGGDLRNGDTNDSIVVKPGSAATFVVYTTPFNSGTLLERLRPT